MMTLDIQSSEFRDLALLLQIEDDPDVSQAKLAEDLGVAIGTVNWHIKRLVEKGLVKVRRARRRKLRYIITPDGMAERAKLTVAYVEESFRLFRQVRHTVTGLLSELKDENIHAVRLVGEGDIFEICRLTCLEHSFTLTDNAHSPSLVVDGLNIRLEYHSEHRKSNTR